MRRDAAGLMRDRKFLLLTFIGAFGFGSFFIFLAAGPFVYQQGFGLSSTEFSVVFAINAMSFIGASQGASLVVRKLGVMRALTLGSGGFALAFGAALVVVLARGLSLPLMVVLLALGNACLGLIMPTTMVLALDDQGERAGLASSLGGTLQLMAGGVMVAALGPVLGAEALPMVAGMAFSAAVTLTLTLMVRRGG